MLDIRHQALSRLPHWHLSLFEKVILVNSVMLVGEALAGLWVTSHHLESQHYLIDTSFIVLATLLTLLTNVGLLRMSFRPLFSLLATMREVSAGQLEARAPILQTDTELGELAQTFNTMLDRLAQARREQTQLILQAQEDERRRIGLELHDETGQNLTALLVHAEILQQSLHMQPTEAANPSNRRIEQGLHQLTQLTQRTLENIRLLAQQLRPSVLEDLGLLAAIRSLVEESRQRMQLEIELNITAKMSYPPLYETALFRILQESLTNIARHAQAHRVTIFLQEQSTHLQLEITDDGRGYTPKEQRGGLGIFGMRQRAAQLGGTLHISRSATGGTRVQAMLPLPDEQQYALSEHKHVEDSVHVS